MTEPQNDAACFRTPQAGRLGGPATLLSGLLFFMLLPPLLFSHTEGCSYGESFYFIFVTLSTVGFGDDMNGWGGERLGAVNSSS